MGKKEDIFSYKVELLYKKKMFNNFYVKIINQKFFFCFYLNNKEYNNTVKLQLFQFNIMLACSKYILKGKYIIHLPDQFPRLMINLQESLLYFY